MSALLQRVVWSEGMLMSPQHFQQQDAYHEALLDTRLAWLGASPFGLVSLVLDELALQAGQVVVSTLSGVLPGGVVLCGGASDDELPPVRSIGDRFPPQCASLDVYVGLASERAGSPAYARSALEHKRARYVVGSRSVNDALAPTREVAVEFARKNLVLLLGDEASEDYDVVKVAEIVRDDVGSLAYDASFIPPCLRLGASARLMDGLRQVLAACVARRRAVVRALRQRDRSRVEFASDEVTLYLALHAVSGVIPLLTELLSCGDAPPRAAYRTLAQFVGQLSAFDIDTDPAALPAYHPADLRTTFDELFARALALLDATVAARVITVALEARVDGMHLARVQDAALLQPGARLLLAVQTEVPEAGVYELVPRVSKVASWAEIPRYLEAAASAVPVTACMRPPREVPLRSGKYYFALDTVCAAWQAVVRERALAVHLPPPFEPRATSIELLAIPAS